MKIIVEISDDNLRNAIEAQVGKELAGMLDTVIKEKVDAILAKKFDRIDDASIEKSVGIAAAALVKGQVSYSLEHRINAALNKAAKDIIREHSNKV